MFRSLIQRRYGIFRFETVNRLIVLGCYSKNAIGISSSMSDMLNLDHKSLNMIVIRFSKL